MLTLHLISGFIYIYICLRLVFPFPVGLPARILVAALLLPVSQAHFLYRRVFGSLASPELPFAALLSLSWLYSAMLFLFIFLVLRDILGIVRVVALRTHGAAKVLPRSSPLSASLLTGAALVLAAFTLWQAVRIPDVRTVEVTVHRLPAELDGLTLAHLTDIHASALLGASRIASIVDRANALQADIILLSGDLVDGAPERRAADVPPLGRLRAPFGVFVCLGNHEYFADLPGWLRTFAGFGLTVLRNEHRVLEIRGKRLVIAGVTDDVAQRSGLPLPNIADALAGAPDEAPRLLLAHRPGHAVENAAAGVDLQLSGHTHGGHAVGLDRVIARYNGGFVSGLYEIGRMRLYVSNGAGLWAGFPVRLGVPSEITRIVLRSAEKLQRHAD